MTTSIRIDHDVPMQTRDGVTLRADVFRPDDGSRYPALLTRTPYGKHGYFHHDFVSAVTAAREGYAVVIQDTRGRFASEGDYAFGMPEGDDSYDTVEWVASQRWCDGAVGMYGPSYMGGIQWEAAMERPPSLRAIAPAISASPVYDLTRAGVVPFEMMVGWGAMMTASMIERAEREGGDASGLRRWLGRMTTDFDGMLHQLPVREALADLGPVGELFGQVPDSPPPGTRASDLLWDFARVAVPILHTGAWYDLWVGTTVASFKGM